MSNIQRYILKNGNFFKQVLKRVRYHSFMIFLHDVGVYKTLPCKASRNSKVHRAKEHEVAFGSIVSNSWKSQGIWVILNTIQYCFEFVVYDSNRHAAVLPVHFADIRANYICGPAATLKVLFQNDRNLNLSCDLVAISLGMQFSPIFIRILDKEGLVSIIGFYTTLIML